MANSIFNSLSEAKPTNSINYLKPYGIYDNISVKETKVSSGTSEAGNNWKRLDITLGNDEGIHTHNIFYPNEKNPKDVERPEYDQSNGGKRKAPSRIEELQNQIASFGFAFFPDDFEKLRALLPKITTVEQLMEVFKKFLDKSIDKTKTSMKLVGRNSDGHIYATLPKFTGIAQANDEKKAAQNNVNVGEWYTWRISPFGDNLAFSNYEQTQADKYRSAKPTNMDSVIPNSNGSEDTNLDDLLAGL